MWWTISGNQQGTVITAAANGSSVISGRGTQSPPELSRTLRGVAKARFVEQLASWEERLKTCKCHWQVRHSPSSLFEHEAQLRTYAEPLQRMIDKVKQAPDVPQWRVTCDANDLSFFVIVPNSVFEQARRQFELVLASGSVQYAMHLRFPGLTVEPTPAGDPSFEQFFGGAPLFVGGHVDFAVYAPGQNDA